MASMMAFFVGGASIAMALNDLTWITFALLAALDRISSERCAAEARIAAPVEHRLVPAAAFAGRGMSAR
jgi:hypothetical protein